MTLWQRILRGVTAFSAGIVLDTVTSLLAARLIFGYLPPDEYGQLALFLTFYATGDILLGFGLTAVVTAEIARARGDEKWQWANFLLRSYLGLLTLLGVLLLALFMLIGRWQGQLILWTAMGFYLLLTGPNRALYVALHSSTRYQRVVSQSSFRGLVRLLLVATLPWWWTGSLLVGVALTYPLVELSTLLLSLFLTRPFWREGQQYDNGHYTLRDLWPLLKKQGLYEMGNASLKKLSDQWPVWFLTSFVGSFGAGAYAAAQRAFKLLAAFFKSVETVLFPLASEQAQRDPERLVVALRQSQKYTFWLGLLAGIAVVITAPWLVWLIAGEEYLVTIPILRLFVWQLVLSAFTQTQRPILYAIGALKWIFYVRVVNVVATAVLLAIGVWLAGPMGAVVAVLAKSAIMVLSQQWIIYQLAPHLLISPASLFRIEEFDRRMWHLIRERFTTLRNRKT